MIIFSSAEVLKIIEVIDDFACQPTENWHHIICPISGFIIIKIFLLKNPIEHILFKVTQELIAPLTASFL